MHADSTSALMTRPHEDLKSDFSNLFLSAIALPLSGKVGQLSLVAQLAQFYSLEITAGNWYCFHYNHTFLNLTIFDLQAEPLYGADQSMAFFANYTGLLYISIISKIDCQAKLLVTTSPGREKSERRNLSWSLPVGR